MRSADEALGVFFAALKARGLYDNTMIVVTSDHGEEFGDHGKIGWHSHTLFDELLRVPLIVKYPGSRHAGIEVSSQVQGIDIAPTCLAGLGLGIPTSFAGRNLAPEVMGATIPPRPAVSMLDEVEDVPVWSIRTPGWKVIQDRQTQLFDLGEDPGESIDVANENPKRVLDLSRRRTEITNANPTPDSVPAHPRSKTLEQLRALGYVD